MNIIINDKDLLTKEIQKESNTFLAEVNKIYEVKNQLLRKKEIAASEIENLKQQLAELDKEYIFETDTGKIKELAQKKKDIRYEIEEYESIMTTKYNPVVKKMLKNLDEYRDKAKKEHDKFYNIVEERRKKLLKEREEYNNAIEERLEELDKMIYSHQFTQANNKHYGIQMDKTDW